MLQAVQSQAPAPQPRHAAPRSHAPAAPRPAADSLALSYGTRDANYDADGDAGPVRRMQQDLQQLGYFKSSYGATGGYYQATRDAVRRFQADQGLSATGRADAATLAAIKQRCAGAPAPVPSRPAPAPVAPSAPAGDLAGITPKQLAQLGRTNKPAFFDALRPAAQEVERRTGVPVAVTLGQAAFETGFGAHMPAATSYNLFGHKGVGPAGSVRKSSFEHNHSYRKVSSFRCYHNFHEAVVDHGSVYEKAYYKRAMAAVAKGNKDPHTFLKNIEGVYHDDGSAYTNGVMSIIRRYDLNKS